MKNQLIKSTIEKAIEQLDMKHLGMSFSAYLIPFFSIEDFIAAGLDTKSTDILFEEIRKNLKVTVDFSKINWKKVGGQ